MFKENSTNPEIDYDRDFKIIIANNPNDDNQLKVHQLKALESFSKSSESLALSVTSLGDNKIAEKYRKKKKTRSASRGKKDEREKAFDYGVSRDSGESFMSGIMANVKREGWKVVGESEEERLRLLNMRLEGKYSVTSQASEEGLRQQAKLRCELEMAKQEVEDRKKRLAKLEGERKRWDEEKYSIKEEEEGLRNRVVRLEVELAGREGDLREIKSELECCRKSVLDYEEKVGGVLDEISMKEVVIGDLKKKMSELYSQLELIKLYKENTDYQAERIKVELEMSIKARKWTEEQLKAVEEGRDRLEEEVRRIRTILECTVEDRDNLTHKSRCLEVRLMKLQEDRIQQTTELLFELEQLQKDIIVNSKEKECLEARYETVVALCEEKRRELDEERSKSTEWSRKYEEQVLELEEMREKLEKCFGTISELEDEGVELRKNVAVLEERLIQKGEEIGRLEFVKIELERKVEESREVVEEREGRVMEVTEELRGVQRSLERVCAEREQSTVFIGQLKEECEKVAEQFELSRRDLYSKEESLKLMEELSEELKEKLLEERKEIEKKDVLIGGMSLENEKLKETCQMMGENHREVCLELDNLRDSLRAADMMIAGMEEEIRSLTSNNLNLLDNQEKNEEKMRKIKLDLQEARGRLEELGKVQKEYGELLELHQQTEKELEDLSGRHEALSVDFEVITGELKTKLQERESELERIVNQKEEIVQNTKKELQSIEKSHFQLQDTLENVKFNFAIEIATKEEQFREKLEKSEHEFSQMCQEKIRCESAIGSLQGHINSLVDDYNRRLKECKSKMLSLEEKSTAYEEYEGKSRALLLELERKKGEIEGVLEEWKRMKQHAAMLETALARREANVVELIGKHQDLVEEKDKEIEELRRELKEERGAREVDAGIKKSLKAQIENKALALDEVALKLNTYQHSFPMMKQELEKCNNNYQCLLEENQILKETQRQLINEFDRQCEVNIDLLRNNERLVGQIDKEQSIEKMSKKSLSSLQKEMEQKSRGIEECKKKGEKLIQKHSLEKKEMKSLIKNVHIDKESLTRTAELSQQREIIASSVLCRLRSEVNRILFNEEMSSNESNRNMTQEQFQELLKLMKETEAPIMTSKPLSRLSKCIDELRTQIDCFQNDALMELTDSEPFRTIVNNLNEEFH